MDLLGYLHAKMNSGKEHGK